MAARAAAHSTSVSSRSYLDFACELDAAAERGKPNNRLPRSLNRPIKKRLPWLTVGITTAAISSQILTGAAAWLQYDRTAIAHGELWRNFTAHFVRFEVNHLGWDVAVLLFAGTAGQALF